MHVYSRVRCIKIDKLNISKHIFNTFMIDMIYLRFNNGKIRIIK